MLCGGSSRAVLICSYSGSLDPNFKRCRVVSPLPQSKGKVTGMGVKEQDVFFADVSAGRPEDYAKVRGGGGRPEDYAKVRGGGGRPETMPR